MSKLESEYLFVYGTLLKDFDSYMSKFLNKHSEFIGNAYFTGRLYDLGWYPGAVASDNPSERVYGNVFKLKNTDEVFKVLDDYEGVGNTSTYHNEYKRELINAYLDDGERLKIWVYIYNASTKDLKRIFSGNYMDKGY